MWITNWKWVGKIRLSETENIKLDVRKLGIKPKLKRKRAIY